MKTTNVLRCFFALLFLLITCTARAATVSWTGGGGDNLWNTPANWSGGSIPGPGDDVIINVAGSPVIVLDSFGATIRSVQCAESFRLENNTLALTGGNSSFTGPVNFSSSWLSVDGPTTVINVSGPTTLLGTSCYAYAGAKVLLTNVTAMVMTNTSVTWQASGAGTAIRLSNLTNIVSDTGYSLSMSATEGGLVDLRRLSNLVGYFSAYSSSPGSVVDFSNLSALGGPTGSFSLSAADGGVILVPKVTSVAYGSISVSSDGQINMPLLTAAEGSSFIASNGGILSLTNLTTVAVTSSSATFSAQGVGSEIRAYNITNLAGDSVYGSYSLTVTANQGGFVNLQGLRQLTGVLNVNSHDAGSLVELSGLSGNLTGPERSLHSFSAQSGGVILIPQVTGLVRVSVYVYGDGQVESGPLTTLESSSIYVYEGAQFWLTNVTTLVVGSYSGMALSASGAGSLIDLSSVTNIVNDSGYSLSISVSEGGQVDLHRLVKPTGQFWVIAQSAGSVVDLSRFSGALGEPSGYYNSFSVADGGVILMPQVTALYNTGINVTRDGQVAFGALTNVEGCSFTAYDGAKLWLTNLTMLVTTNGTLSFQAQGADSAIYLSYVTNVVGTYAYGLNLSATDGGFIDLHRLRNPNGAMNVSIQGEGSLVDLSSITGTFSGPSNSWHSIGIQGGTVLMPGVNALERASVYVYRGGNLATAQLRSIISASLTIDGITNDFSQLTNIVDSSINAYTGAKLWFTNVTVLYATNGTTSINTSGTDAAIYFPNVTNVVYGDSGYSLYLSASSGGEVDLHRLPNPSGRLSISSTSPDSVVNLSAFNGTLGGNSLWQQTISISDQGTILMPGVNALDYVSLYMSGEVGLPLNQFRSITRSSVSIYSSTNDCSSITNIFGSSIAANSGAKISLSGFSTLYVTNGSSSLQAGSPDSAIYLPHVTNVVIDTSSSLYLHAYQGGLVDLHAVGDISGGTFTAYSRYQDAVIDLSGLTALTPRLSGSNMQTSQGGVILLNDNAVLIFNVGLYFEASPNSIIPDFANPGTDLVLYAHQWNAYLIEARDTRVPNSPWNLYLRVPMTNAIQTVSARPPADLAFRVTPLLAEPPALRVDRLADQETQLTLFGVTGQTYRLESKSALGTAETWQNGPTVTLTNAFRIFPDAASADPSRYYRARKL